MLVASFDVQVLVQMRSQCIHVQHLAPVHLSHLSFIATTPFFLGTACPTCQKKSRYNFFDMHKVRRNRRVQTMRPACPTCSKTEVTTLGGGSINKYRYKCDSCSQRWSQTPPTADNLSPNDVRLSSKHQYKCGLCGKPKSGHVCSAIAARPPSSPVRASDAPATSTSPQLLLDASLVHLARLQS